MIRPVRTAPPAALPVSTAEAKEHLRVDHSDDDTFIGTLVGAAVSHLDGYAGVLGRCLVNQQWRQDFKDWEWRFRLPFPDLSSVTVTYQDEANATQTVAASDYEIVEDERGSLLVFKDAFEEPAIYDDIVAPIRVAFTAGFGDAADVPDSLKAAIKLMVGHWYENREAVNVGNIVTTFPMAVDALIAPYRWVTV